MRNLLPCIVNARLIILFEGKLTVANVGDCRAMLPELWVVLLLAEPVLQAQPPQHPPCQQP